MIFSINSIADMVGSQFLLKSNSKRTSDRKWPGRTPINSLCDPILVFLFVFNMESTELVFDVTESNTTEVHFFHKFHKESIHFNHFC